MTGNVRAEENRVTVRGLSQRLQLTGWQASWQVQGEFIPPVYPLPGGKILAIVKNLETDALALMLWDREGHELGRSPLDIVGEVKTGQVFGNRFVVASASEVVEIDTGTLHKGRARSFVVQATKTTLYRSSPTGLWVVSDKVVSYFDLDGRESVEKSRPLAAIDKPRCPDSAGDAKQPCSCGLQLDQTGAIASEAGDLLLIEAFKEIYPYGNVPGLFDEVWPSTATVLDTRGAVVVQKALSWMNTKREWFWSKGKSPQDPTGIPRWGGLVRTRYETERAPTSLPFASRGSDFLFWKISDERDDTVLFRTNRGLETVWKRKLADFGGEVVAPTWAAQVLFHDNSCRKFSSVTEHGNIIAENKVEIREILLQLQRTKFKRPRFAIGQSSEGDWLLIAY